MFSSDGGPPLGAAPQLPQRGERIAGYIVDEVLGRGAMGAVYAATSEHNPEERVALKVLLRQDGQALARLDREAEAGRVVGTHPHGVPVLAAVEHRGCAILILELIEGESLDARIARGELDLESAWRYATETASALAFAHERGIVHRDLKPANILIDDDDRARVTDFGLSKGVSAATLTRSHEQLGTPAYMAPEQIDDSRSAGPPADVFALGVILYEMVCGVAPFRGESLVALMAQVASVDPTPPKELCPELTAAQAAVILRALEKQPERRFADGAELEAALLEAAEEEPSVSAQALWAWAAAGLSLAALAALLLALNLSGPSSAGDSEVAVPSAPARDELAERALAEVPLILARRFAAQWDWGEGGDEAIAALSARPATEDESTLASELRDLLRALAEPGDAALRWPPPKSAAWDAVRATQRALRELELGGAGSSLASLAAAGTFGEQRGAGLGLDLALKSLSAWGALDDAAQDAAAHALLKELGEGWAAEPSMTYECGGQTHRIARFRHTRTGLVFHLIPGGRYIMGPRPGELAAGGADPYQREATIGPMLACATELTQGAWARGRGAEAPQPQLAKVLSWDDGVDWLEELGAGLELPSEAEWEYLCRAGTETTWAFGDSLSDLSRYAVTSAESGGRPGEVSTRLPNAFGLTDMHGNLAEWCRDCWVEQLGPAPTDGTPRIEGDTRFRVVRGGSVQIRAEATSSSFRSFVLRGHSGAATGIRPIRRLRRARGV